MSSPLRAEFVTVEQDAWGDSSLLIPRSGSRQFARCEQRLLRRWLISCTSVCVSTLAVLLAGGALLFPSVSFRSLLPASTNRYFVVQRGQGDPVEQTCQGLFGQCGGEGYEGPTCCVKGSVCKLSPLQFMPSFHMCMTDDRSVHQIRSVGAVSAQTKPKKVSDAVSEKTRPQTGLDVSDGNGIVARASEGKGSWQKAKVGNNNFNNKNRTSRLSSSKSREESHVYETVHEGTDVSERNMSKRNAMNDIADGWTNGKSGKNETNQKAEKLSNDAREVSKELSQEATQNSEGNKTSGFAIAAKEIAGNAKIAQLKSRATTMTATATTTTISSKDGRDAASADETDGQIDEAGIVVVVSGVGSDQPGSTCSRLWDQCGGKGYSGPTCCESGSECRPMPLGDFHQCRRKSKQASKTQQCSPLWGQCGGEGYDGPTCCQHGSVCESKPLPDFASYRQCRKEAPCSKLWSQCGGDGYDGARCCEAGSVCVANPSPENPTYQQCRDGPAPKEEDDFDDNNCGKLWDQCGGIGFNGSTCCKKGTECRPKPLPNYPSFYQCLKPACEDPAPGTACHKRVQWDMSTGIWTQPGWYRGLTAQSEFKEFQEYEHRWNEDESQCNAPCADGPCFVVFRYEGCDTMNKWTCEVDDGSLAFACCCKYFHDRQQERPQISADLSRSIQASHDDKPSLFCVSLCFPVGYEFGLLNAQYNLGVGMFDCTEWAVYSNISLTLVSSDGSKPATPIDLFEGSLDAEIGGKYNTALNTDIFIRFWNRVIADPKAWRNDWIIKLDPDTMFLPGRFRALVSSSDGMLSQAQSNRGVWLNNCHLGLHGPIEALSQKALATYRDGWKKCAEGDAGGHGQEDVYLRVCFNDLGIPKINAYNLLFEAKLACQERPAWFHPLRPPCFAPQVAFHPFKSIDSYKHCYDEAMRHPWALPTAPVFEKPSKDNQWHA